jgi:hypothetical protein
MVKHELIGPAECLPLQARYRYNRVRLYLILNFVSTNLVPYRLESLSMKLDKRCLFLTSALCNIYVTLIEVQLLQRIIQ